MKTNTQFFACCLQSLTKPKASLAKAPNFLERSNSACSFDTAIRTNKLNL